MDLTCSSDGRKLDPIHVLSVTSVPFVSHSESAGNDLCTPLSNQQTFSSAQKIQIKKNR